MTALSCVWLASSCVDSESINDPELIISGETPEIGLRMPAEIYSNRMLDLDQVRPEVTISDVPITVTRSGDVWAGVFTLPQTGVNELSVTWIENFEGQDLVLASRVIQIDANSPRDLTLTDYDSAQFDDDFDGASNLLERELGRSPFENDSVVPDCGLYTSNVVDFFPTASSNGTFRSELTISGGDYSEFPGFDLENTSFASFITLVDPAVGGRGPREVFLSRYNLLRAGRLTVVHETGNPTDSVISIHEAKADLTINVITENNDQVTSGQTTSFRARISVDLEPGIYCVALVDRKFFEMPGALINAPAPDMFYEFEPR